MTQQDKDVFVAMAQAGLACGLEHPCEWFVNWSLHMISTFPYERVAEEEAKAVDAFVSFMRGTASHPDDPIGTLTKETLGEYISDWYKARKPSPGE